MCVKRHLIAAACLRVALLTFVTDVTPLGDAPLVLRTYARILGVRHAHCAWQCTARRLIQRGRAAGHAMAIPSFSCACLFARLAFYKYELSDSEILHCATHRVGR